MPAPARSTSRIRLRRVLARRAWIGAAVAATVITAAIAYTFFTLTEPGAVRFPLRLMGATVLVSIAYFVYLSIRWRTARRRAADAGGLLCPCCLYTLGPDVAASPHDDPGTPSFACPECGHTWSRAELRAHWSVR